MRSVKTIIPALRVSLLSCRIRVLILEMTQVQTAVCFYFRRHGHHLVLLLSHRRKIWKVSEGNGSAESQILRSGLKCGS